MTAIRPSIRDEYVELHSLPIASGSNDVRSIPNNASGMPTQPRSIQRKIVEDDAPNCALLASAIRVGNRPQARSEQTALIVASKPPRRCPRSMAALSALPSLKWGLPCLSSILRSPFPRAPFVGLSGKGQTRVSRTCSVQSERKHQVFGWLRDSSRDDREALASGEGVHSRRSAGSCL